MDGDDEQRCLGEEANLTTPLMDFSSTATISWGGKDGGKYKVDDSFSDQRLGQVVKVGSDFDVSAVETLLKNPAAEAGQRGERVVTRKVRITKHYFRQGPFGSERANLPLEVPVALVKDLGSALLGMASMLDKAPKPDVDNFIQRSRCGKDDDGVRAVKIARNNYDSSSSYGKKRRT